MQSRLLDRIHAHQNRTTNAKVVFADIVSYSKRRSQTQAEVVDAFMEALRQALDDTASAFIKYIQANELNFESDVIRIPSGDGAAIAFPFEGIHDVHLGFAKNLLKRIHEHNSTGSCDKFNEQGWCNCHSFLKTKIGVAEGKVVLYRDLNGNYNIAGTAINMAARVMGLADPNQVLFTEDAYRQLIDMVDNPTLDESFIEFRSVPIKHGLRIKVYQFADKNLPFLNCTPTQSLTSMQRMTAVAEQMSSVGMPVPFPCFPDVEFDMNAAMNLAEQFAKLVKKPSPRPFGAPGPISIEPAKTDDKAG
jgi:class 3 adenylate cyclase